MGEKVGGYAGGVGAVAGGEVDDDDGVGRVRWGQADKPTVTLAA